MKNKFKLTPQANKAIIVAARELPKLVKVLPNGKPQYRKCNTYEGTTEFNVTANSYTKNTKMFSEPVYLNHEVELRNAFSQYGDAGVQRYIQRVHEINNAQSEPDNLDVFCSRCDLETPHTLMAKAEENKPAVYRCTSCDEHQPVQHSDKF